MPLCRLPFLFLALLLTACAPELDKFLQPLAEVARSAVDESDARINRAYGFLKHDVAPLPHMARAAAGEKVSGEGLTWDSTPFIAVGVTDTGGKLMGAFPRAGDGIADLLTELAQGPELGDLTIIPNTFTFTLGLNAPLENGTVTALLDVEQVLLRDVLHPAAATAGGFAFLANHDRRVILSTRSSLAGSALKTWNIPAPNPGEERVANITVDGDSYHVATAASSQGNGWIIGVAAPNQTP